MANPLMELLGYVGETLDKPGRAFRGILAGRPDELLNLVPFSDTAGWTDPAQRTTGRQLLEKYGMLDPGTPGEFEPGDVAGFGADLLTDPLNWLGAGYAIKAMRANKFNNIARAGNEAAISRAVESNAAREVALAKNAEATELLHSGALPSDVLGITEAVDESGNPLRLYRGSPVGFQEYGQPRNYYTDPRMASDEVMRRVGEIEAQRANTFVRTPPGVQPLPMRAEMSPRVEMAHLDVRRPFYVGGYHSPRDAMFIFEKNLQGLPVTPEGILGSEIINRIKTRDIDKMLSRAGYDVLVDDVKRLVPSPNVITPGTIEPAGQVWQMISGPVGGEGRIHKPFVSRYVDVPFERPIPQFAPVPGNRAMSPLLGALGLYNAGVRGPSIGG